MAKIATLKPTLKSVETNRLTVISSDSWRSEKTTSAQRGYGYKWQQARAGFLRKHPLCVMCESEGIIRYATVVDHSTPHRGDMAIFWDSSKWQSLCSYHHDTVAKKRDNALK